MQLVGCLCPCSYLIGAVDWISLQLSGCYLVGAVGCIPMSFRVSGRYSVGAVDWMFMSLQLVGCFRLVQLIGYRCSCLVVIWLVQLIG